MSFIPDSDLWFVMLYLLRVIKVEFNGNFKLPQERRGGYLDAEMRFCAPCLLSLL
jgi:hypothetical protein